MNQANKVIKYIAIAFAIFLILNIVSGIIYGFSFVGNIFNDDEPIDLKTLEINQNIKNIDIDVKNVNITVKTSDLFGIETNNKYISYTQDNDELSIKENKHFWLKNNTDLIIYIPPIALGNFKIKTGAGKVVVDNLIANDLKLNLGAGKVEITSLEVLNNAKIDGGAGEISIKDGIINNLDMDMGVGKVSINSKLLGDNEIDAGVGELNLNLTGSENDYSITVDKGIGSIKLSGNNIKNGVYGNGNNKIDIDGGVGSIKINFDVHNEIDYFTTFIKTYNILNVIPSQEKNTYYLTIQQFQGEVDTVLVRNLDKKLAIGKNYEFKFEKDGSKKIDDNIDSIFKNTKILSITETNKKGLDQIQDPIK